MRFLVFTFSNNCMNTSMSMGMITMPIIQHTPITKQSNSLPASPCLTWTEVVMQPVNRNMHLHALILIFHAQSAHNIKLKSHCSTSVHKTYIYIHKHHSILNAHTPHRIWQQNNKIKDVHWVYGLGNQLKATITGNSSGVVAISANRNQRPGACYQT
jgi:hypothetical protein